MPYPRQAPSHQTPGMHRHPQRPSRYERHHTSLCRIPSYNRSCRHARRIHIFCSRPLFFKAGGVFLCFFPMSVYLVSSTSDDITERRCFTMLVRSFDGSCDHLLILLAFLRQICLKFLFVHLLQDILHMRQASSSSLSIAAAHCCNIRYNRRSSSLLPETQHIPQMTMVLEMAERTIPSPRCSQQFRVS